MTPGSTSNSGIIALYNVSNGSFNHTTLSGENSLWVHVSVYFTTVAGVTFNGDAMTQATVSTVSDRKSYWFYLANPDIGTYVIAVTYAGTGYGAGGAIAFSGTNTSNPLGATSISTGINTDNPTDFIDSTVANSYILEGFHGTSGNPTSPGANEIEIYELTTPNVNAHYASYKATTSIGTYSMSEQMTLPCDWAISLVEVLPGATITTPVSTLTMLKV